MESIKILNNPHAQTKKKNSNSIYTVPMKNPTY